MQLLKNKYSVKDLANCLLNSYSAIFFSQTKILGIVLLLLSFLNPTAGIFGLISILLSGVISICLDLNKFKVVAGYYGFNAALTGIAIGSIFPYSTFSIFMLLASSILVVMLCIFIEGILTKYSLPYLSLPFLIALWCILLTAQGSDDFTAFGILPNGNATSIESNTTINGIRSMLNTLPNTIKEFFLCISFVFFQSDVLFGFIVAVGLLFFSRIGFIVAIINHIVAYAIYTSFDINLYNIPYHFIGFNFLFTGIAIGCYYIIPSKRALVCSLLYIPVQYMVLLSSTRLLSYFYLPTYSFAFCSTTIIYLYFIRVNKSNLIAQPALYIEKDPEKTLYNSKVNAVRLNFLNYYSISLPFIGTWKVFQGHNGEYTHKGNWRHAWDFVIEDSDNKQYTNNGTQASDYYCFGKPVMAPSNATVVAIENQVEDNAIGFDNKEQNWGNYVILKVSESLYIALCHLKQGSITVQINQQIAKGQRLGLCGNSGHSTFPHIHMQFQTSPIIGSTTIAYPISDITQMEENSNLYIKCAIPEEGVSYCNAESCKDIYRAFNLTSYKNLVVKSGDGTENWELKIDDYGLNYIDDGKGNYAWFNITNYNFYFYRYEGQKDSNLYSFYLSSYNTHLTSNYKWEMTDTISLNTSKRNITLFIQDCLAIFHLFYKINYTNRFEKETSNDNKICFHSEVKLQIFGKEKNIYSYKTTILDKKLYSIEENRPNCQTKIIQIEGEYYE